MTSRFSFAVPIAFAAVALGASPAFAGGGDLPGEIIVPPIVGIPDVNVWHDLYRTGLDNDGPFESLGGGNTDVWEVTVVNISAVMWGDFHIKFSAGIGALDMIFVVDNVPKITAGPWTGGTFALTADARQADFDHGLELPCLPPGASLSINIPVKDPGGLGSNYHLMLMATPCVSVPAPGALLSLAGLVACGRRRRC